MNTVRSMLLDDPGLRTNQFTEEAARRTEMVKGQLLGDAFRSETKDEFEFLCRLAVALKVIRMKGPERIARVVELIQRTNQFDTTLLRLGASDMRRYVADSRVRLCTAGEGSLHELWLG